VRSSWKVGTFAGIGVYIHSTFLILILWILFIYWNAGHNAATVAGGLLFTLALFVCVVLHEFGHALTARMFGIGTRDITLLPIGGVSNLERMPEEPGREFLVAIMGPAVSIGIAGALFLLLKLAGQPFRLRSMTPWTAASFVERLILANIVLAAFNLLPAFPMDGGRILRAVLARYLGFARATDIAARVGRGVAVLFGLVGLYGNPFLFLIAIFVWIGAGQESARVQMKSVFAGVPVSRVTVTDIASISVSAPLRSAVELVLHGTQQDFPVTEEGRFLGILTNKQLLHGLAQFGPDAVVSQVMLRNFHSVHPEQPLQSAVEELQSADRRVLPVVDGDRFLGFLTRDNVAEFVLLQTALRGTRRIPATGPGGSAPAGEEESRPKLIA
jgi:Zn-dependent protease